MISLTGRTKHKEIEAVIGQSLMKLAVKHKIDWGFSCTRGTCARCRCLVEAGMEYLAPPTEAEKLRLEPEEIEQGFRLGCQATIVSDGPIKAQNKPYF